VRALDLSAEGMQPGCAFSGILNSLFRRLQRMETTELMLISGALYKLIYFPKVLVACTFLS